jgi:CheY-like chemotaxis protein
VLYVEDNVSNPQLIEDALAEPDVEIIAAANGRLALELGADAHLTKPIDIDIFKTTLAMLEQAGTIR